ncbi:MAG: SDR family oxidoreductase [Clostridiales Family XIII bacterium]|jgi:NAD(P)-dependent dehydrogenase (short-subunit alcohol dehydrogenase family)|nr:SDR family oxidoreductase [Clostridiales Family XIII bacterium]
MKLKGKVAIVTGASAGMGKAIARLFSEEGAIVIAVARRKERLDELTAAAGQEGGEIVAYSADLSVPQNIEGLIDFVREKYKKPDIVVNNAGILDEMTPAAELTDELWDRILQTNLTAVMQLTRGTLRLMLEQGGGVFVNIASVGGLNGCRGGAAYTASKFGLIGFTKNVGFMYANKGVRANALCPGAVSTEIAEAGLKNASPFGRERVAAGFGTCPRNGEPEDVAAVALFLASDDASFVNGATLAADAGWTAY